MKRRVALSLAALAVAGLAQSAQAQYGYPAPPMGGYPPVYGQPMGYMPMPYPYAPGGMPMMGQPMVQPIMVPVVVTQPVPVFGALESMPAGGPLDGAAMDALAGRQGKPAAPEAAPAPTPVTVQTTAAKATTHEAKKPVSPPAADKPAAEAPAEPAKPKVFWRIKWLDGK
jgi:hypothetical protein